MFLSHSILLDCGEGTLNQLLRVSGEGATILSQIQVVLISHSHADHHLGLPLLLAQLAATTSESPHTEKRAKIVGSPPLLIIGPPRVRLFLEMWNTFIPSIMSMYSYLDIPVTGEVQNHDSISLPSIRPMIPSVGITTETLSDGSFIVTIPDQKLTFKFFPVWIWDISNYQIDHCDDSVSMLVHTSSFTLMYSGDGRPNERARNFIPTEWCVDVLVNECTFSDDRQEQAKAKNHCTCSDALSVGEKVNAKYTILTHFSQRYPKNLSHDQGMKETHHIVPNDRVKWIYAHDLMEVSFNDLESICLIRDELEACFASDEEESSVYSKQITHAAIKPSLCLQQVKGSTHRTHSWLPLSRIPMLMNVMHTMSQ